MAGYLDTYGVTDQKRAKQKKRIILIVGSAALVGLVLFLVFHNFREKRALNHFLTELRAGNYQQAYALWGCTPTSPCRDYSFVKFMEDWGPKGQYPDPKAARVGIVDACGEGVVMTLEYPKAEPFGIWVDRKTQTLSFAPWPRCPGRHWHFLEFIQRHLS